MVACLQAPRKVATLKPHLPCFVCLIILQLQLASIRPNMQHAVRAASAWFHYGLVNPDVAIEFQLCESHSRVAHLVPQRC